jgi:hypothetical protein
MPVKLTVSVKLCVAFGLTPLLAVKVMGYVPAVPEAGVPLSTPVPALNVTPEAIGGGTTPVAQRISPTKNRVFVFTSFRLRPRAGCRAPPARYAD